MQKQCGHILRSIDFSAAVNHTKPQVVVQSSGNLRPNVNFPIEIKFIPLLLALLNKSDLFLKKERESESQVERRQSMWRTRKKSRLRTVEWNGWGLRGGEL